MLLVRSLRNKIKWKYIEIIISKLNGMKTRDLRHPFRDTFWNGTHLVSKGRIHSQTDTICLRMSCFWRWSWHCQWCQGKWTFRLERWIFHVQWRTPRLNLSSHCLALIYVPYVDCNTIHMGKLPFSYAWAKAHTAADRQLCVCACARIRVSDRVPVCVCVCVCAFVLLPLCRPIWVLDLESEDVYGVRAF